MPRWRLTGWCRLVLGLGVLVGGLAGGGAFAQEAASVSGVVRDQSGGVLPGVTVTALNTASGRETLALTDETGRFEIKGLAGGTYRITASLSGFADAGRSVTLTAGQATTVDLVMGLGSLTEAITVTAAKGERTMAEIPQVVTLLSPQILESRRPPTVMDSLDRVPNLRSIETNPYRARPQLRGLSSSRVLVIVDGEKLNNARYDVGNSGVSPSWIDMSQVESIEVVGGAASSLYGSDAVAGTINIITKAPARPAAGSRLDLKFDIDGNTNSGSLRGAGAVSFATSTMALRASFAGIGQENYKSGGKVITKEEVVELGNFYVDMGLAANQTTLAQGYAVFELPEHGEVTNGTASGTAGNVDLWIYPSAKQKLRLRYIRNRLTDTGFPFSIPPYDPFLRINYFTNLDKVSARYDFLETKPWMPRITVGGYWQELKRPQNDLRHDIVPGSSYSGSRLTGNLSQFTGVTNDTETLNHLSSYGTDVQINIQPSSKLLYTTGVAFFLDQSRDTFNRRTFTQAGTPIVTDLGKKSTPDADYRNIGWFNQVEYSPNTWLRLSGGFRVDNWFTKAMPSPGFPPGNEAAVLTAALPALVANPGPIQIEGLEGLQDLVSGTSDLTTNNNVVTGNVGATVLLPFGLNPYFRFATSYREPEMTTRYIMRNFGAATISIAGVPNTVLKAEEGKNIDFGVKTDFRRGRGTLGYFRNRLTNGIGTVFSPSYCVPADPSIGIQPTPFPPCVFTRGHQASFFQRVNFAKVLLQGVEGTFEIDLPIGTSGSITPFLGLSWLKGTNESPDQARIDVINKFYNRDDTPIKLTGSPDDVPFSDLPEWQGTVALRYNDARERFWVEYEWRWNGQITRADPGNITSANVVQYGLLRSLDGFNRHTIRGGYYFKNAYYPLRLTATLENLTDALYFTPYNQGPSIGRAFIVGLSFELKDLLRK